MNLLEMLMGSSQTREGFKDFLSRFEDGPPSEGYSDREVLDRRSWRRSKDSIPPKAGQGFKDSRENNKNG